MPPISVYEASDLYFVSDGHHRVALAREDGAEFIDAEATALRLSHQLHPGVDLLELVHTELNLQFMDQTGLAVHHPEAQIEFSRPIGYWELKDLIEARAYEISAKRGEFIPTPEATSDWFTTCWLAAQDAIDATNLARPLLVQDTRATCTPVGPLQVARAAHDRPLGRLDRCRIVPRQRASPANTRNRSPGAPHAPAANRPA